MLGIVAWAILVRTTVWRHWIRFFRQCDFSFSPIEPKEIQLCFFLMYLYQRKLSFLTIKTYFYSLVTEIKLRGGKNCNNPERAWFIHSTFKFIRRDIGGGAVKYRRPLTIDLLAPLIKKLDLTNHDTRVMATMVVVGVFGLFRVREICYIKNKNHTKFIRNCDIIKAHDKFIITLYNTKTDIDKKGIKKYLVNTTNGGVNPFLFLQGLRATKTVSLEKEDALFSLGNGRHITRKILVNFLRDNMKKVFPNIPSSDWNGISLRKGGATSAIRAGVPDVTVQKMGSWKSDIYKSYVDHTEIDVTNAQRKMASFFSE